MSIRIHELARRKRQYNEDPQETREYLIGPALTDPHAADASDIDDVELALSDGTGTNPAFTGIGGTLVGSLVLKTVEITAHNDTDNVWLATATWGKAKKREDPPTNAEEISFDISPQTTKITQSLDTVNSYGIGGADALPYGGGIGFNGKGFDGCDKIVPAMSFTITQYLPVATITNAYIQKLEAAAGHVNNAGWRGRAAGEVLFTGVSGSKRSEDDYTMSFKFLSQPTATGLSVGQITGIQKGGWEHLWVSYREEEATIGGKKYVVKKPFSAYCEKIYESISFPNQLGITA